MQKRRRIEVTQAKHVVEHEQIVDIESDLLVTGDADSINVVPVEKGINQGNGLVSTGGTDLVISSDEVTDHIETSPLITNDIAVSSDTDGINVVKSDDINDELSSSGNADSLDVKRKPDSIPTDISISTDEINEKHVTINEPGDVAISQDVDSLDVKRNPDAIEDGIARSDDVASVDVKRSAVEMSADIQMSPDEIVESRNITPEIDPAGIIVAGEETVYKRREFGFQGKWLPSGDPASIGPQNYAELKNFRHTDYGVEGVGGNTRINTTPPSDLTSTLGINTAIQFNSNYDRESYIVSQLSNTSDQRYIMQHTASIPDTRCFDWFRVVTGVNDEIKFTSSVDGTAVITITAQAYTGEYLADTLKELLDADGTLGNTVTWTVSYAKNTGKFTITPDSGTATIVTADSTGHDLFGFTSDPAAAASISSDIAVFGVAAEGFFVVAGSNDALIFTSDQGGPRTITLTEAAYTSATLSSHIATQMNADATLTGGTITFAVTYDSDTEKFTIDATGGHTIALTYSGSTAADTIGFTEDAAAAQTITSDNVSPGDQIYLIKEDAGASEAKMSLLPNGNVGICDGKHNYIWGGEETSIGAFYESSTVVYRHSDEITDNTELVTNIDEDEEVEIYAYTSRRIFIGTRRPASGFYFNVGTANTANSTMSVQYYNGTTFKASDPFSLASNVSDGTSASSKTLAQSGWVTFDVTEDIETCVIKGRNLYFYYIEISAVGGSPTVYGITARESMRDLYDIWSGEYERPLLFRVYDNSFTSQKYTNYTLEVQEPSFGYDTDTQIGAKLGVDGEKIQAIDYMVAIFNSPISGLYFKMHIGNSAADTSSMEVYQWVDNAWGATNLVIRDTTSVDASQNTSFNKDGIVSISNSTGAEHKTTIDGVSGYAYKIEVSNDWSDNHPINIDYVGGIPLTEKRKSIYSFPFSYKNMAMWCGSSLDREHNRVDYSIPNGPDSYGGSMASGRSNQRSIYFGDNKALTAAVELYNRYVNKIESRSLFFKNTETYLLTGDDPETFRINKISGQIGCPAYKTIAAIESSVSAKDAPEQNVVMWLSSSGPVMYQSGTIKAMIDVECFFDGKDTSISINRDYIDKSCGWYDYQYKEYNLVFPSGTSATTNNKWIVYDMIRDAWYEKSCTTDFPYGAFPVEDTTGNKYIYGYTTGGYLLRLENGLVWSVAGSGIENTAKTGDILPNKSMWSQTTIYRTKTLLVANQDGRISVRHYKDGAATYTSLENAVAMCEETTLAAAASTLETSITVTNDLGMKDGDNIGILLDSGSVHWTTIDGTPASNTVDIDNAMPSDAASGKAVYFYSRYYNLKSTADDLTALTHAFEYFVTGCTATKPCLNGRGILFGDEREDVR